MIGFILLLLALAFLTAGEMASVSSDLVKLKYWTEKNVKGSKFAFNLLHNQDRLIMTMLVGSSLTMVAMSVIANKFWYNRLPSVLVSLVTTIVIFVFAEVLPKALVLRHKERFFLIFAKFFVFLYWLFSLFIFLSYYISLVILKILDAPRTSNRHKFTREEVRMATRRALPIIEQSFVARLLEFKNKTARDIMVPKSLICSAPITSDIQSLKNIVSENGFSRIPIYDKTIDNVAGYVLARDLLTAGSKPLTDIIRPCRSIPETMPVTSLLDELRDKESFLVIVKDAGNKTTGILTMEDIIEELLGEIEDEYDIT